MTQASGATGSAAQARRDALLMVTLFILPFLFFWQVWRPGAGQRLVFTHGDFVEQHYPMRVFVTREYSQGRLPLWDPYTYAGGPAAATGQIAAFYPPALWRLLLGSRLAYTALELECILHLGLAAVFTFLLVRRLTGSSGAGFISGVAFGLGGYLTSYPMLQVAVLETAIWLPACLWLLERALQKHDLRQVIFAGLALGLALLAGHPQTFLYLAYMTLLFGLVRGRLHGWSWLRLLYAGLLLALFGAGLAMVQLLPTLELLRYSARTRLTYAEAATGFGYRELLGLFHWNARQWSPLYVGVIPLALAAVGLARRAKETWVWGAVIGAALLLSLGDAGLLYKLAYHALPGFALFRQQERVAILVSLGLAVLAGYGYRELLARRPRLRWLAAPLALAAALNLYVASQGVILTAPPEGGYLKRTATLDLVTAAEGSRVWRTSSEGLLTIDGSAGLMFEFRDVTGNNPLHLAAYEQFLQVLPEVRWMQLLNVQRLVTRRDISHGAFGLLGVEGDLRLYNVALGGRTAWVAHAWQAAAGQDEAMALSADDALDPFATAVLESTPDPLPTASGGEDTLRVIEFGAQRIALEAALGAPGILVLSEVSYPGWTVRVNGKKAQPLRAFGLLRAVALPAGDALVEWRYEPLSVYLGLGISGATCALALVCLLRKRRPARAEPTSEGDAATE